MLSRLAEGLRSVDEIQVLLKDIEKKSQETLDKVRSNGVILDEYNRILNTPKKPSRKAQD